MYFNRQSGQQQNSINRVSPQNDYEIKTFTRARSPVESYSQNFRRSPIRTGYEQGSSESALGEMIYIEPNDNLNFRRQNMSPLNDSRNLLMRSPGTQIVRNDYTTGGVINMSQQIGKYSQAPRIMNTHVEIESRKDRFSRSPKTINLGESPQEMDFNLRTLNRGASGDRKISRMSNSNSPQPNFAIDRSYNMMSNETGNIFLEQPMIQQQPGGSNTFINSNGYGNVQQQPQMSTEPFNSSTGFIQGYEKKNNIGYLGASPLNAYNNNITTYNNNNNIGTLGIMDSNTREIQFAMNPRDYQEPIQGILRKASPKGNVEGDSDSGSEKADNVNEIKDLKTQLDRSNHVNFRMEDGIVETRPVRNDFERMEDFVKSRDVQDNNVTGEDVKKLLKYYVKTYDPHKGEDGNLISNKQTIIQPTNDQLFNDRYKVLQKMNKLSTILLAKNRNASPSPSPEPRNLNRSYGDIDEANRRRFDKSTLDATVVGGKKTTRPKRRKNKFLYVSLAMLSAKGPNVEDRTILRRMRLDKGGVVDLAQEGAKSKTKFKIVKARVAGRGVTTINPKYREKAAKVVQQWWRERKEKYKKILEQIIKIQSVWRGKFTRKYVYDIIYISYLQEKFIAIMRNVLVNHIRPYVFDTLFSKKKLVKDFLVNLLEKNDRKYSMLRIRPYFMRWYEISQILKQRFQKTEQIVRKKEEDEKNNSLLKKYFDEWALRCNLEKFILKAKDEENAKKKFFGTLNMINGLSSLAKRQVHKNTHIPVVNYLKEVLLKKYLKKIVENSAKKDRERLLRQYLNKWKKAVNEGKLRDLRKDVFLKSIKHIDSRIDKKILKEYFDRWRRQIPQGSRLLDINEGVEILKRFTFRTTYIDPLNAFSEKCDIENMKESLLKLVRIKNRKMKDDLRKYFDKWRNRKDRLNDKDNKNEIYVTLLKDLINGIDRKNLYKRFYQWKQRPKVDVKDEMAKINNFIDKLKSVIQKHYLPEKRELLDDLSKRIDVNYLKRKIRKLVTSYGKKESNLLRYYFYKWRSQAKNDEISDLHLQLLKYLIINEDQKKRRNLLSKYLTRWRLFTGQCKNYDTIEKLKKVLQGGDILNNLYNRRIRDLITRLYRNAGKDYRPIFLKNVAKRIEQPRSTLGECFNKWRRLIDKEKAAENIRDLKGKIVKVGVDRVRDRTDRDMLMKAFFRWKAACLKNDDYYPRLLKGFELLNKYTKQKYCEEPYDRISNYTNYERPLRKVLKNYENQKNRLLDGKLRNLFGRWRKAVGDGNVKELKTTIIYKTKNFIENIDKMRLLTKYFTRWKLYRKKGLDINFHKGIDLLDNTLKKICKDDIIDAFKTKTDRVCKEKALEKLKSIDNMLNKKLLRDALMTWLKHSLKIDPNRMTKIKTRLRRLIKKNDTLPLLRALHKWENTVLQMNIKEKDMIRTKTIIANTLRNNDRFNLNGAMNRWKKKIQLIREQYLKSLLVKQIKTAQNVKEDMNNQARLRRALLKWRSNLIPVDYLERLKQIRKGCKLFKLGLKKKDGNERQLFDGLKNLAEENYKKKLLNEIIRKVIPGVQNYHLKRCIDIWKSKLGDTDRMKNKLKNLLDDYLYSDKVHDGLFKQPKNDIIDAMNKHTDNKKMAVKKIEDFLEGISGVPKNLDKLKSTLKLKKIVNSKDRNLRDILRARFIQYYRQTQKIKNDENARIIQRFIKEKLRRLFNKKDLINQGYDKFILYLKRRFLNNLKNESENYLINKVLREALRRKNDYGKKLLRDKFNHWRYILPLLRKEESASKIQNAFRNYLARKKVDAIRRRSVQLKKLVDDYDNKNNQFLISRLRDWQYKSKVDEAIENAKIIQRFCRMKMDRHNKKLAMEKLRELFRKTTLIRLKKIMAKSSRIIGGKGEVVYKTLQDILYRTPYDDMINKLRYVSKIVMLKKIVPKVFERNKKLVLPYYLKKWKENTYDVTVRSTEIIQKFLRDAYNRKMKRNQERKEILLLTFLKKLDKTNKYRLQLPFNIWSKKAKLAKINEAAEKIQNAYRNHLANEKLKDLRAKKNFEKLSNKLLTKQLASSLKKCSERNITNKARKRILLKILGEKITLDDKNSLKVYFDKWRRYVKLLNDKATIIENAYRCYRANKEKNRLKRLRDLLEKYVNKHIKTDNDLLRSKLRKYQNIVNQIKCDENSRIIQNFIRPRLARLLNKKFKDFFNKNAKKKVCHLINLMSKMNKLQRALFRPSLDRFNNNLKKITKYTKIQEILRKILGVNDTKNKTLLLRKYLLKWKDQSDKLTKKMNDSASTIQRAYLSYKARKERDRLKNIKDLLYRITLRKNKITQNKLYSTFTKWNNKTKAIICDENARIIQEFCRGILDKIAKEKELKKQEKIKKGLEKLLSIKFGAKDALDKIKSERNRNVFKQFNDDLKQHRLNTLKECFDNIKQRAFDNKLRRALKIPDDLRKRILDKILKKWEDNANKLRKKRAAEMIQKNWRLHRQRKRKQNGKSILKKILIKLINKKTDIANRYLHKWNDNAKKMKINAAKQRAAKYLAEQYKKSVARKNWEKLCKDLYLSDRNKDIYELVKTIKYRKKIESFEKPFINIARRAFFKKVLENQRKNNLSNICRKLFPRLDQIQKNSILRKYVNKWNNNAQKLKERENKLKNAMDTLDKKDLTNQADTINKACLLKKLLHDIPRARAKDFFDRLRQIKKNKDQYNKLSNDLVNANDKVKDDNKKKLMTKVYKLYVYQKLNDLMKAINHRDNEIQKNNKKAFLIWLLKNKNSNSEYKYENNLDSSAKPKTTKINFRGKTVPKPNKDNIIEDKIAPIKKCLPSFIKYLNSIIKKRNQESLDKLKHYYTASKFCKLLKLYAKEKVLPPKKDLIDNMKREKFIRETRPASQLKLFKLFRKKTIRTIITQLEETSRLYKLFYLINITKMHKNIANQRFLRELIRKWRFISFTKKMARKKLELMYKNLHASYMQMADEIFGDDEVNPSVIKEFERFGTDVGMFTGQEPEIDAEVNKKYYTTVDKKYVFNNRTSANFAELQKKTTKTVEKYIEEQEEEVIGGEEYPETSSNRNRSSIEINNDFSKIKRKGLSSKYFKNEKKDDK